MMNAAEVKIITKAAREKNEKLYQEQATIDVEERIMPAIIKAASEGKSRITYTVDPLLRTYVAKILKDLRYSVTETNYKYIVEW